ncbi:SMP-30/gluconolactonase/LRE family protein [Paracoccus sp. SY]|uniref:SMP-30/gluconolactonase/LRE family protein n=1 Tax=Paracoccus sp. SY TaxID=1330255 RepID=UPI001961EAFE|nr:SMP-30/gluconolactonase/LRE family protein [Paracoccus sp. SY]
MTLSISPLGAFRAQLGECPVWDWETGMLWLVDGRAGLIVALDPETGEVRRRIALPAPVGSFALNDDGRLVVALRRSIALVDPVTSAVETLAELEVDHPNLRLNDGVVLPDGSFLMGTMHIFREPGEAPLGGLYRLSPDGATVKLATGIGVTNGPRMGPDGCLYVCDSAARRILRFGIGEDWSLEAPEIFATTDALDSAPDGCVFDAQGILWTALVHAGALAGFDPQGRLVRRIEVPVAHPASLCIGGPEGDRIFVTSISDSGRLRAQGPLDGNVLRITGAGVWAPQTRRANIRGRGRQDIQVAADLPDALVQNACC